MAADALVVWAPDDPERALLDGLDGVRVELADDARLRDGDAGDVAFVIAHWAQRRALGDALPRMASLRAIQALSAGVDWLLPMVPAGITLCDARGVHDIPVAEWVVAATLASVKRLPESRDAQGERAWRMSAPGELAGATVLIVGYGSIGAAVEARLAPFGVEVVRVARHPRPGVQGDDRLAELLPRADVVVLLLPLTPETEGMVDARFLELMRPGALFVNAARGPLVDTDALLAALHAGRVRAALDVTQPEPLPPEHPLWSAPGALITPHVAGHSPRFLERGYTLARRQIERLRDGEPLENVVSDGY